MDIIENEINIPVHITADAAAWMTHSGTIVNVIQCDNLGENCYKQSWTVYDKYTTINHDVL